MRKFSYHHPLVLTFDVFVRRYPGPFKYMAIGKEHLQFRDLVKENWDEPIAFILGPVVKMTVKLKRLKLKLKQWNW